MTPLKKKARLDEILLERGLVKTKDEAFLLCSEGMVIVDGQKSVSPAQMFSPGVGIRLRKKKQFVGRGALKLEAALKEFDIDVKDKIGVDIGSATGGFTEVLLNHGAAKVYAIDTAHGKLDIKLREDPRVVVMEKTDIRHINSLPEAPQIAVIDISLIPLKEILPHAHRLLADEGECVALLKPQYETRDPRMLRHGVVESEEDREYILDDTLNWISKNHWEIVKYVISPVKGGKGGNREYLLHLRKK